MKRRNADCGRLRRPVRRSKIAEGILGSLPINNSTFVYIKFLLIWIVVLLVDFVLEFRFEYLWPFWLLLRSVYDSFKYQGLAFSVFFVFVALTSDMICFLFIPVHWLFFAASTYVWVQYVWHTERGISFPTVFLWLLFVYIEASVRLKELKSLPFHLDLCRPFAAHCIGYPVVTLGFGFKSYVSYRMRLRKQKEVAKENDFYVELLQQALPPPPTPPQPCLPAENVTNSTIANGTATAVIANGHHHHTNGVASSKKPSVSNSNHRNSGEETKSLAVLAQSSGGNERSLKLNSDYDNARPHSKHANGNAAGHHNDHQHNNHHNQNGTTGNSIDKNELQYMENNISKRSVNDYDEECDSVLDGIHKNSFKSITASLTSAVTAAVTSTKDLNKSAVVNRNGNTPSSVSSNSSSKWHNNSNNVNVPSRDASVHSNASNASANTNSISSSNNASGRKAKNIVTNNLMPQKDEHVIRLEADIKRLKADLQSSRQTELDLRSQLNTLLSSDRTQKAELAQLQQDNENLQTKLHNLVTARQQDKQSLSTLEKKLVEEKKAKGGLESQLATERKNKKVEADAAARALAVSVARAPECTDSCKGKKRDLENDLKQARRELKLTEDQLRQSNREAQSLRQYKDSHGDTEILMSALSAMQDKNAHLENSLSAETRLKLDLFSALGDTKRQLEIAQAVLSQKDKEIDELKSKIAEVMAVMPPTTSSYSSLENSLVSSIYYNAMSNSSYNDHSSLDPNSSSYTSSTSDLQMN